MVDGMDLVDDVDTAKNPLRGCVHSVHRVHSVHCLDKFNWLPLPNLIPYELAGRRGGKRPLDACPSVVRRSRPDLLL